MLFGSFLLPKQMLARKKKTESIEVEKSCCKKTLEEKSKESPENNTTEKKSCCEKTSKNVKKETCKGECNDCSCENTCSNIALMLPFATEIEKLAFFIIPSNYFETKSYLSTGFISIWTPPNIR
jgi:hypothetical protein